MSSQDGVFASGASMYVVEGSEISQYGSCLHGCRAGVIDRARCSRPMPSLCGPNAAGLDPFPCCLSENTLESITSPSKLRFVSHLDSRQHFLALTLRTSSQAWETADISLPISTAITFRRRRRACSIRWRQTREQA